MWCPMTFVFFSDTPATEIYTLSLHDALPILNTNCGFNNGTATATASGGTGNLTYNWTPSGGTNANATGLAPGVYTVTVTDANGCTQTATVTIAASTGITPSLLSQVNLLCSNST